MAEKLNLPDIGTLGNPNTARAAINSNFTAIENAFDNTLSRDGTTPNQMEADIDLNGYDLLNVRRIDADELFKNGVPFEQTVAYANKNYQLLNGTGAQTSFPLTEDPGSLGNLYVSVGGSDLKPGIDYNYSGTTLTFTVAPASGTNNIYVRYDRALPTGVTTSAGVSFLQSGSGAVTRNMQEKARDVVSVKDFGAVGYPINDSAAFQVAATRGGEIFIPTGDYSVSAITAGSAPVFWNSGVVDDGGGLPLDLPGTQSLWFGTARMFYQAHGGITDDGTLRVQRTTDYSGAGAGNYENSAIKVLLTTNAAAGSYETGILSILDNYASTAAQNVALHLQANKRSTSATWCSAQEAVDLTGAANPTTGLVGIEQVMAANGTDSNGNRVGIDVIASRPNSGGVYSGTAAEIGVGLRLINQVADGATLNKFVVGVQLKGYYKTSVIDTSSAVIDSGGIALRLGDSQKMSFSTAGDRTMHYTSAALRYQKAGVDQFTIDDSGNTNQLGTFSIQGVQILSSRSTGWSAPTGTLTRTAFDTATVTTSQLAERVAALITDLRNHHGIIGA